MPRIEPDLIGFRRIDLSTSLHRARLKPFFGLIRNGSETDSRISWNRFDSFGLNFNPKLLPGQVSEINEIKLRVNSQTSEQTVLTEISVPF